jgi:hypothetical protein
LLRWGNLWTLMLEIMRFDCNAPNWQWYLLLCS